MKNCIEKILAVLFWLLLWKGLSLWLKQEILLASPEKTLLRLGQMMIGNEGAALFWGSILRSCLCILLGFFLGLIMGCMCAWLGSRVSAFDVLLHPLCSTIKSAPVVSFIILFLIWADPRALSVIIAFLMMFPLAYVNLSESFAGLDPELEEMAAVYELTEGAKFRWIYLPQLLPGLRSACSLGLGLCWKSGVAAEVIGLPGGTIGEKLYQAKIYLETADLFAWTLVIILLSVLFEKGFLKLLDMGVGAMIRVRVPAERKSMMDLHQTGVLQVVHVTKQFGDRAVLKDVSLTLEPGQSAALMGASGGGKSTLLRILLGLDTAQGEADMGGIPGVSFQRDLLIGSLTALENVLLFAQDRTIREVKEEMEALGLSRVWDQPAEKLSGGERRRVSLLRALLSPCSVLLLDEPFTGLDEDTRALCMERVKQWQKQEPAGKLLLLTHRKEEAMALCQRVVSLE